MTAVIRRVIRISRSWCTRAGCWPPAGLFETLWTLGIPVSGDRAPLSEQDRMIVALMAAGVTDDVIARRPRLSRRTVTRRIAALLDRLGATTRFQAGVQAAHRGWL
jgi:DNA-binding NarL/FixJ family response regulator